MRREPDSATPGVLEGCDMVDEDEVEEVGEGVGEADKKDGDAFDGWPALLSPSPAPTSSPSSRSAAVAAAAARRCEDVEVDEAMLCERTPLRVRRGGRTPAAPPPSTPAAAAAAAATLSATERGCNCCCCGPRETKELPCAAKEESIGVRDRLVGVVVVSAS